MRGIPLTGMVGALFMGDGDVISEAGGIIFDDAGASNYGRNAEPTSEVGCWLSAHFVHAVPGVAVTSAVSVVSEDGLLAVPLLCAVSVREEG